MQNRASLVVFRDAEYAGKRLKRSVRLRGDAESPKGVPEFFGHRLRRATRAALAKVRQVEIGPKILEANDAAADPFDLAAYFQRELAVYADAAAQVADRGSDIPCELGGVAQGHGIEELSELFHNPQSVPAGHGTSITTGHLPGQDDPYNPPMTIAQTRQRALRALIERRFGGVQARFGIAIGRQADYVSRLLSGKKALGEKLAREIEQTLGLSPGELDREPPELESAGPIAAPLASGRRVPILAWESLVQSDHNNKEPMLPALPAAERPVAAIVDYAPRPANVPDNGYALIVRGPAMEPEFRDGWLVFVDDAAQAKHGDFVIARPEGRETPILRQLVIEGDAKYLRCLNASYPEPMLSLGAGKILGRVVYQGKAY